MPSTSVVEKLSYCQRCLNHGLLSARKGHKSTCHYSRCACPKCSLVEERRVINGLLNPRRLGGKSLKSTGRKERSPKCALCQAHGISSPLHKKQQCPFKKAVCTEAPYSAEHPHVHPCEMCICVDRRRALMAEQIKLRRQQNKSLMAVMKRQESVEQYDSGIESASSSGSSSPTLSLSGGSSPCTYLPASTLTPLNFGQATPLQLPTLPAVSALDYNTLLSSLLSQMPTSMLAASLAPPTHASHNLINLLAQAPEPMFPLPLYSF